MNATPPYLDTAAGNLVMQGRVITVLMRSIIWDRGVLLFREKVLKLEIFEGL